MKNAIHLNSNFRKFSDQIQFKLEKFDEIKDFDELLYILKYMREPNKKLHDLIDDYLCLKNDEIGKD